MLSKQEELAMIDNYNENKWDKFELSGRISDYLDYIGIPIKIFSGVKEERADADNSKGSGNCGTGRG